MRDRSASLTRKSRARRGGLTPSSVRLHVEQLEDRRCPTSVFGASFGLGTAILNITELSNGSGNLVIYGDTPPGGGITSMITVAAAGFGTTINGMNAVTFSTMFPGAITQINLSLQNGNHTITIGSAFGILNLPSTTMNVSVGDGNNVFTMGYPGNGGPAVNDALNALNWRANNINSTGSESVNILNSTVSSINVQQNSGPNDAIRVWGVTANGFVNLIQNNGSGDSVSIDQLATVNPSAIKASLLGVAKIVQGNGSGDVTSVNRTMIRQSLSASQGNGDNDQLLLGTGDVVSGSIPPPGLGGTGPVLLVQGAGSNDYLGVDNLIAGVTTLIQQDQPVNPTGDTVGGVATAAVPPGSTGLDAPSATTAANVVTATGIIQQVATVPTNGFANAVLEQLTITQGSAPGDLIALEQLSAGAGASESLNVTGAPFFPGAPSVTGTLTIRQQDIAGNAGDLLFMGSYIPSSGPLGPLGSPPYLYTPTSAGGGVSIIGSITAMNEVVTQGDASGDFLSVLFNTDTSPTTFLSSLFTQGNGGDDAIFQENTAVTGGFFNYQGGFGGNYVQADSNNVIGLFDGGGNPFNVLGQDNNNSSLFFVDFSNVIVA